MGKRKEKKTFTMGCSGSKKKRTDSESKAAAPAEVAVAKNTAPSQEAAKTKSPKTAKASKDASKSRESKRLDPDFREGGDRGDMTPQGEPSPRENDPILIPDLSW